MPSRSTKYAETSTVLLAGATRNGITHTTNGSSKFRVFASSDVAGTINIQQSRDGTTWYITTTQAITTGATVGTVLESIVSMPKVRAQYVNGGTNQASFEFDSELIAT